MRGIKLLLLVGLSGIFLLSCDKLGVWEKVNSPDSAFMLSVVSTSPSAGEGSIPVNSVITVTFNDNVVDATLLVPGNFTVQNGGPVAGVITNDHVTKTATFTPGAILSPSTAYTVILTMGIKNAAGEGLDSDYSFSFTTAAAFEPEFDLLEGLTPVAVGDIYDFGTITEGGPSRNIGFTINNPGTGPLLLSGVPFVQVPGPDFTVSAQPVSPIAPAGSDNFTISLNSLVPGAKTAVVTIPNDDATENPYTFTVIGTVLPHWDYRSRDQRKAGHHGLPLGHGIQLRHRVTVGTSSVPVPFTIENLGNDNLTVNSIVLGGIAPGMFSRSHPALPAVIPPGGSIVFTVTFSPTALGSKKAEVHIDNDDSSENPYIIKLKGRGT